MESIVNSWIKKNIVRTNINGCSYKKSSSGYKIISCSGVNFPYSLIILRDFVDFWVTMKAIFPNILSYSAMYVSVNWQKF